MKNIDTCFIAASARIIGNVTIGKNCSIFYNAVIRGDRKKIIIGNFSNVQDNCVIHAEKNDCTIGNYVSIGHGAIVHGAKISDNCIIGMGAIIMENVKIGENCIIGAGTLITENKEIPANSVVISVEGKIKILRQANEEDIAYIRKNALDYVELGRKNKEMKIE